MPNLLLMRHGLSSYNLQNRFTGSLDVPLSNEGIIEAKQAATKLKGHQIHLACTSKLKRAIDTLQIILDERDEEVPVIETEALNERCYGELQGLDKADAAIKYGEAQVLSWRRSYKDTPPGGESLSNTADRVIPFYHSVICVALCKGLNVLVVAHGNSLRAIIKELNLINDEDITHLNIDTGKIYVYELDHDLKTIGKRILQ